MARINVNTLTSVLARMPDGDLQKYAEMHKSDPYVMALAMSESNRRKEMRSAGQGTQEEQPKVVDQMIAGMAPRQPMPEDMGIGAIPAPNMTMANGGIAGYDEGGMVAFADGGEVERYAEKGLVQPQSEETSSTAGRFFGGIGNFLGRQMAESRELQARIRNENQLKREIQSLEPGLFEQLTSTERENLKSQQNQLRENQSQNFAQPAFEAYDPLTATRRSQFQSAVSPVEKETVKTIVGPSNRMAAPARFDSIEDLQKKYFGGLDADKAEVTKRREEVASGLSALAQSNLSEEEARIAGDKDLFKNKDARLARQEKELAGLDQRNMGLAIFKMGATMMGTRGGIAAAIGAGAGVGAEAYASGIAKIDLAKEKFAEAQDRLDNLKINRNDMNAKELRAATRGVKEAELQGLKLFQDGSEKDLGLKRQELGAVFTAAAGAVDSDKKIAAQQQIAAMQASTKETDPRMQVFKALVAKYDGDVLKANAELQTMGEGTIQGLYKKELVKKLAELETSPSGAMLPAQQENIARIKKELFGGSFATPSPEAIAFLKANPNSAAQFDAKFNNTSDQYLR